MIIDGRNTGRSELLNQLKELFCSCSLSDDSIEVLVSEKDDARQVKAFAAMSGFSAVLFREPEYYRVSITGSSCGCFR